MTFPQAAEAVGKNISSLSVKRIRNQTATKRQEFSRASKLDNPDLWNERIEKAIERANKKLLGSPERLAWLRLTRGLTAETVERFRLGWVDNNLFKERTDFGLPSEINAKGKPKKLFVPAGLVIPGPKRLRIRKATEDQFGKYYLLPGSDGDSPLTINFDLAPDFIPAIVVESELDAILLSQEVKQDVSPLFAFVATGSTSNGPSEELLENLRQRPFVLISLDNDSAGGKASWGKWLGVLENAKRVPIPASWGKDHTEAFLAGHDLGGTWLDACCEIVMGACGADG
jgi:hypothetical protein